MNVSSFMVNNIHKDVAQPLTGVVNTVALLESGATIPFIAVDEEYILAQIEKMVLQGKLLLFEQEVIEAMKDSYARLVKTLLKRHKLKVKCIVVSEAGASVYSASELAGKEYPDLDVTVRGAISIAHRVQDSLAELVKIDPKAIGVGQYQHDLNRRELKRSLGLTVESCVNFVGVDLMGTVTNVTNFGAFIDVGVHQDGLIHISQLADIFVKSPYDVVAVGDTVQVDVLSVDIERKRISLKRISGGRV